MIRIVFLSLSCLALNFSTTVVKASSCQAYLMDLKDPSNRLNTNKSQTPLSLNPYLFQEPKNSLNRAGVIQFGQTVETPYGSVILRTKELEDLISKTAVFRSDEKNMARYINAIFTSVLSNNFNDSGFLNWLQKSYEQTLRFRAIDFSKPSSGFTSDFMMLNNSTRTQMAGILDAQAKARTNGSFAPVRFRVDLNAIGRPSEWLNESEHVWIFRILMREPIVRKLLHKNSFFADASKDVINEAVFFISAFPELFELSTQIEDLGFKFNRYFLTDGFFTESAGLKLGEAEGFPIMSNLVIEKDFTDLMESSYTYINVEGYGYHELSELQIEDFKARLNQEWDRFKEQHQARFNLTHVKLILEPHDHFTISIDMNDNTEVTALFYLHLLNKKKLFYF